MEQVLKAIWRKVESSTDLQSYKDLYYFCKETMKTNNPLGIEYLLRLSDRIEAVIPQLPSEKMGEFLNFTMK